MKIKKVKETPRNIREFPVENELGLSEQQVEDVAEIFETPLTGAYNWDYTIQDNRIKRLYELGKELNWNAGTDIDWSQPMPDRGDAPPPIFWDDYKPYQELSNEDKFKFLQHRGSWSLSQFLHGEQGALLVASQLVSCAPTFNAKLYAASQTFDEARHVEAFNKYIQTRQRMMYPIGNGLKSLLDKILTDLKGYSFRTLVIDNTMRADHAALIQDKLKTLIAENNQSLTKFYMPEEQVMNSDPLQNDIINEYTKKGT